MQLPDTGASQPFSPASPGDGYDEDGRREQVAEGHREAEEGQGGAEELEAGTRKGWDEKRCRENQGACDPVKSASHQLPGTERQPVP